MAIAASPDGIISCSCHEKGVLEIKCPFTHRHESIVEAVVSDSNYCLKEHEGSLQLDRKHAYYYQMQTQMFVCDVNYCDFCVCTFPSGSEGSAVFVERICRDVNFWSTAVQKSKEFFSLVCYLKFWEIGISDLPPLQMQCHQVSNWIILLLLQTRSCTVIVEVWKKEPWLHVTTVTVELSGFSADA